MGTRRIGQHLDLQGNRLYNVGPLAPAPLSSTVLDFADTAEGLQKTSLGLASTFSTANLAAGRCKTLLITTSGLVALPLSFPTAWLWYGSKLTTTILSKEIRLTLTCYGSTDADVRAEWAAQV